MNVSWVSGAVKFNNAEHILIWEIEAETSISQGCDK